MASAVVHDLNFALLLQEEEYGAVFHEDEKIALACMDEYGHNYYFGSRTSQGADLIAELSFPLKARKHELTMSYSTSALQSWVEQTKLSCGATSIANALNALSGETKPVKTIDVLKIFINQVNSRLLVSIQKLEKEFASVNVDKVFRRLRGHCFGAGDQWWDYTSTELYSMIEPWLSDTMDLDTTNNRLVNGLKLVFKTKIGVSKLARTSGVGPSTMIVGNMDLCRAAVTAGHKFKGMEIKTTTIVSNRRNPNESWKMLNSALDHPQKQVLFHLTGHYALIFAAREFLVDGKRMRQVLTSKEAQAPQNWVDWEEALEICHRWVGYKIIQIENIRGDKKKKTKSCRP